MAPGDRGDRTPYLVNEPAATQTGKPCEIERLLQSVARGDEPSFGRLYDLTAARVYGLARKVIRDPVHAEDIAQEVMVEVWRSASRFDPSRGSATAWILTITHRRAVDRVRYEQSQTDVGRRLSEHADVAHDEVVERVTARLEGQQVRRCLHGLTELQREAITLAYYQGLTYSEVARLLGTALPTIKSRMRDGLIRLRDCLGVEISP